MDTGEFSHVLVETVDDVSDEQQVSVLLIDQIDVSICVLYSVCKVVVVNFQRSGLTCVLVEQDDTVRIERQCKFIFRVFGD